MSKLPAMPTYSIPLRYRKMENLHILFWLLKDLSWCLEWKVLAMAMIVPTFTIALVITWRNRHIVSELCHNAAITIWIAANSYWMITEFVGIDASIAFAGITYKHLAVIPFAIGLLFMLYYYCVYKWVYEYPLDKKQASQQNV